MSSPALLRWILLEGMLPLFGAGLLYLFVGLALMVVRGTTSVARTYAWRESIDSLGWLYGSLTIAIQSAIKCFVATPQAAFIGTGCIICASRCALLLLLAMTERGQNAAWKPPLPLQIGALVLAILTIVFGYSAQSVPAQPSAEQRQPRLEK
jgi:hypothetical protein